VPSINTCAGLYVGPLWKRSTALGRRRKPHGLEPAEVLSARVGIAGVGSAHRLAHASHWIGRGINRRDATPLGPLSKAQKCSQAAKERVRAVGRGFIPVSRSFGR
jgi:hypothetical protein